MPLEMRPACEKCQAPVGAQDLAFICSYECTFCFSCAGNMSLACPNCGGELVRRPRRTAKEG